VHDSLAANANADQAGRIVAHFHCMTRPNRSWHHDRECSLTLS
jgi:hypothetical protein